MIELCIVYQLKILNLLLALNDHRDTVAEKKCSNCFKMKKRTDFSKVDWKKEDGSNRACWSCSRDEDDVKKSCQKCGKDKARSFFAKVEWANVKSCTCNECQKAVVKVVKTDTVKKVKASKEIEESSPVKPLKKAKVTK